MDTEGSSNGGVTPDLRMRIPWTLSQEASLLELAEECEPEKRGFRNRLSEVWNLFHPECVRTAGALVQKLYKLRARGVRGGEDEPQTNPEAGDEPEAPSESPMETDLAGGLTPEEDAELDCILAELKEQGEGNLAKRGRPGRLLRDLDQRVTTQVDRALVEKWETMDHNPWEFNCLLYAGKIDSLRSNNN